MAKDFIIFYSGREGSSAIISTLSAQPEINVPVFEELERHRLGDTYGSTQVAELIDRMFATGLSPVGDITPGRVFAKDDIGRAAAQSIGLKLRPTPDLAPLIEVMAKHGVLPFILVRTDLTEAVDSQFLSETAHENAALVSHPQFGKFSKTPADWETFKTRWNQRRATATSATIRRLLDERVNVMRQRIEFARRLQERGFSPRVIHYADYTSDRGEFVTRVKGALGVTGSSPPSLQCKFERVNEIPARKRVNRLAVSLMHRHCIRSRFRFSAALRELKTIAPPLSL